LEKPLAGRTVHTYRGLDERAVGFEKKLLMFTKMPRYVYKKTLGSFGKNIGSFE
jgi:hypothetical protein